MALPSSEPPSRPAIGAGAHDLSDAEFAELDALLAGIPEPLQPLDPFMLDGFLAALVVQPQLIEPERWLPYVFDAEGHRWGEADPSAEQQRARDLVLRRFAVLNRMLAEFGGFDPWIARPGPADSENADAPPPADPVAEALLPWVAGFDSAAQLFPGLDALDDVHVEAALEVLYRHLPGDDAAAADRAPAPANRPATPGDLDAAVFELVDAVAELYELTTPLRYKVDSMRRDTPKVGRNDACPCGSGRKFKRCHGAGGVNGP